MAGSSRCGVMDWGGGCSVRLFYCCVFEWDYWVPMVIVFSKEKLGPYEIVHGLFKKLEILK